MATLLDALSSLTSTPAIIIPDTTSPVILSHKQLSQEVLSFREKLDRARIARQNAVAIVLPNSLEFAVTFLAVAIQRAICAPLNPAYKEEEFQFYLEDLGANLVLVPRGTIAENGEIVKAARKCNCALAEVYFNGSEVILDMELTKNANGSISNAPLQPEPEDIALILHTSGTTGRPKAVRNLVTSC